MMSWCFVSVPECSSRSLWDRDLFSLRQVSPFLPPANLQLLPHHQPKWNPQLSMPTKGQRRNSSMVPFMWVKRRENEDNLPISVYASSRRGYVARFWYILVFRERVHSSTRIPFTCQCTHTWWEDSYKTSMKAVHCPPNCIYPEALMLSQAPADSMSHNVRSKHFLFFHVSPETWLSFSPSSHPYSQTSGHISP